MKLEAGQIIGVVEGRQCIGRRFGERLMLPDGGLYLIDATAEPVLVAGERGCRAAGVLEDLFGLMVERFAEFRSLMPVMYRFNGLFEADSDERTLGALAQSIDHSTDEEILAVFESELPKKIGDMEFCRAFSNVQLVRNLLVREVPEEKLEHLAFPCCQ